jgi:magnesium-transporting ATPase (P-type)
MELEEFPRVAEFPFDSSSMTTLHQTEKGIPLLKGAVDVLLDKITKNNLLLLSLIEKQTT